MKILRSALVSLVLILLSAPVIHGQDLSKYRNFSFGATLADVLKQVDRKQADVKVLQQQPALIQQFIWWPLQLSDTSFRAEPIQQILFSFYNGELYRIAVTYDSSATKGLTAEDMIQAISAKYGTAIAAGPEIHFSANDTARSSEKVLAQWGDSQYSISLFQASFLNSFGLVMYSKQLDAQAEAAIAEARQVERQEGPKKEVARLKKEVDDLEAARLKNIKAFRP